MEPLSTLTEELRHEINLKTALIVLDQAFDSSRPRRYISGIAISSRIHNGNGDSFYAAGVEARLPAPLLFGHDWNVVIGKVIALESRGDQLRFIAEISNSGLARAEAVWAAVLDRRAACVSVQGRSLVNPVLDRSFVRWHLDELSIAEEGSDRDARIQRVWTRLPYVSLSGPSETEIWSAP